MRYAHLADDPVQAAVNRVARTIAGALGAGESAKVVNLRDGRQSK
jgi:hypothetical protein